MLCIFDQENHKSDAVFIAFYLMLQDFDGGPSVDDDRWSPTFLAPGIGFIEDSFSMDPGGGGAGGGSGDDGSDGEQWGAADKTTPSQAAHLLLCGPVPNSYITYLRWCLPACHTWKLLFLTGGVPWWPSV